MKKAPISRVASASLCCKGCLTMGLLAAVLSLFPAAALGGWDRVDEVLREVYGEQEASQCRDYYSSLDISADEAELVSQALERLDGAGYPSATAGEYIRLLTELSRAGIHLEDLTNKVTEGVAKKVSPERLTVVMVHRVDALKEGRVLTLKLAGEGIRFLDQQMTYTVVADYLLRGVRSEDLMSSVAEGKLDKYPALENLIR